MISRVHNYIEAYSEAGADIITIHPEATDDLNSSILKVKKLKKKVGISLNPETKTNIIYDFLDKIQANYGIKVNYLVPDTGNSKDSPFAALGLWWHIFQSVNTSDLMYRLSHLHKNE